MIDVTILLKFGLPSVIIIKLRIIFRSRGEQGYFELKFNSKYYLELVERIIFSVKITRVSNIMPKNWDLNNIKSLKG